MKYPWWYKLVPLERLRLSLRRDHAVKKINAKVAELRSARKHAEVDDLERWAYMDVEAIEEDIALLAQRRLFRRASRLLVPTPRHDEKGMWDRSPVTGWYLLTRDGIKQLRAEIRQERRERREGILTWGPMATGIIGSLIGLLAVLREMFIG